MHRPAVLRRVALLALLAASGCGPSVGPQDAGSIFDAQAMDPPPTPVLTGFDTPVPWPVATLRGRATSARRIYVRGPGNPIFSAVLPDETFCVDVPLGTPSTFNFELFSQGNDGQFSEMSANASIVFDPGAPPVSGATTCDGSDPAGCIGATEICGNGRDDDCNGLRDDLDPACATCMDDVLEPNNDTEAPRVDPGRYENLKICPGNQDYYGLFVREGETLNVRLFFSHAAGNIDAELLDTDWSTVLERATSLDDDESLMFVATVTGEVKLHVFGAGGTGGVENTYTLDVDIIPAGM